MVLSCSRAVPVGVDAAFRRTLPAPLPSIFGRWYGPITPVRETRDAPDQWGSVGQTRTVVQVGGGTMHEEITSVDAPHSFGYRLTRVTGALKPLISAVDGKWSFEPAGTGTLITWSWTVLPASRAGALLMPVVARLWQGYARQALEDLSALLLTERPAEG